MDALAVRPLHEIEAAYQAAFVYVYIESEGLRALPGEFIDGFGDRAVRAFAELNACVSEAMDMQPKLLVLDVKSITPQVQIQLQRLRNEHLTAHMPVLVRVCALNGWELSQLIHNGASAVVMADIPVRQLLARAKQLLDGDAAPPSLPDKGVFKAIVASQAIRCKQVLPDEARLSQIRRQYRLDLDCVLMSHGGAGGDLWDVIPIDQDRVAIVSADVCGHGLHVAAHTLRLAGLLKSEGFDRGDPAAALAWLNDRLKAILPAGKFAAMAYAVIDTKLDALTVACSSHMPPLLGASTGVWRGIDCSGLPLGFMTAAQFEAKTYPFPVGSGLLLYSDALVETPLPPNSRFDSQSLATFCNALPATVSHRAPALNKAIIDALQLQRNPLEDDLTLLCLRRL